MKISRIWTGAVILAVLGAVSLAAPLIAQLDPTIQHDPAAGRHLAPGTRRYLVVLADGRRLLAERFERKPTGLSITRRGRPLALHLDELHEPERPITQIRFPLGTDHLGRDCLSRLLHGARLSLLITSLATLSAGLLGLATGTIAAARGGIVDTILMRLADSLLAFPPLFLLLLLLTLLESGVAATICFLAVLGWMPIARIVRSRTAAVLQADFMAAVESVGQSLERIFLGHLLPHLIAPLTVAMTLRAAEVMLLESALSFLGLGVRPPAPTLGGMIAEGATRAGDAWWVVVFPGLMLSLIVIAINSLADGLRSFLDYENAAGVYHRC